MGTVIWHVTMSLDGFIAGPNDSMDWVVAQWSDGGENTRDLLYRTTLMLNVSVPNCFHNDTHSGT